MTGTRTTRALATRSERARAPPSRLADKKLRPRSALLQVGAPRVFIAPPPPPKVVKGEPIEKTTRRRLALRGALAKSVLEYEVAGIQIVDAGAGRGVHRLSRRG